MVDNLIKQGRAKPGHYLYSNKKLKYDKARIIIKIEQLR
jgi:hypothetical protein